MFRGGVGGLDGLGGLESLEGLQVCRVWLEFMPKSHFYHSDSNFRHSR
jgi:hypothetical protein